MPFTKGKALAHTLRDHNKAANAEDVVQEPERHDLGPAQLRSCAPAAKEFDAVEKKWKLFKKYARVESTRSYARFYHTPWTTTRSF